MRGQAMLAAAAVAAVLGAAAPAAANDYHDRRGYEVERCQDQRNSRTAAGAVIGGVLGAVIGNNVAGNGARGEGAVLGGVVGAVAGGAIARRSADCDERHARGYDPYGYERGYRRDDELLGGPTPAGYGRGYRGEACGYEEVVVGHGRNRRVERVWVCDDEGYGRY
ncbi:MAG: glycine zipper domain-containing protein [Hyphomonadaceae bacterium]|nr:glycine zipper domain-containing protein [Hyphomonadaceae bacterium]